MGKNKKLLYVIIIAVAVIIPVMMEHNIIFKQSKYIYLLLCLIGIYTIVTSGLDIRVRYPLVMPGSFALVLTEPFCLHILIGGLESTLE